MLIILIFLEFSTILFPSRLSIISSFDLSNLEKSISEESLKKIAASINDADLFYKDIESVTLEAIAEGQKHKSTNQCFAKNDFAGKKFKSKILTEVDYKYGISNTSRNVKLRSSEDNNFTNIYFEENFKKK